MADSVQGERRGVRVTYEHEESVEQVEQSVRTVHRHTVTIDSDCRYLVEVLAGGAATALIGATAYLLKKYFGEIARPLAPNCVIYEVSVAKKGRKSVEQYVSGGYLKSDLQKSFENVEEKLRQILGDEYNQVNPGIVEALKKTKIASVELCDQESLQRAWKKFWQIQEKVAPETPKPAVSLDGKLKEVFGGKIPESKLSAIVQTFKDLGVGDAEDVAHLTEADVAQKFGGGLSLVEQRKLMEFVKGHERPLPPSQLRLTSSEYPNTAITVFFDDPNKMMCDYIVTGMDMESGEEFAVDSSSNFGVLKDLKPRRRYVIYAQCVSNDVRSKKTFFGDVIKVFGYGVQSAPTIDSAYQSEQPPSSSIIEDDIASVVTKSEVELGEDAQMLELQKKDVRSGPNIGKAARETFDTDATSIAEPKHLHGSAVHNIFKRVFLKMSESDMGNLLSKSEEIGIQLPDDFRYLKEKDVANELKGTLKIVELKKLLEFVKEEKYKSWTLERSSEITDLRMIAPWKSVWYSGSSAEEGRKRKKI